MRKNATFVLYAYFKFWFENCPYSIHLQPSFVGKFNVNYYKIMVQGLFMKEKKEICISFMLAYTILRLVFLLFINFMNGTIFVFIYLSNLTKEKHFVTQT